MVAGRVDVLTDTQAIELDWLKGNKWREGIGQGCAVRYGRGSCAVRVARATGKTGRNAQRDSRCPKSKKSHLNTTFKAD